MMSLNHSTLLALLGEHPYATADLAHLLGMSLDSVTRELRLLAKAGHVKRVGTAQDWALSTHVTHAGRKPHIDHTEVREKIRAALTDRALATSALITATGYSRNLIKNESTAMLFAGELQRFGNSRGCTWGLPGSQPPQKLKRLRAVSVEAPAVPIPEPDGPRMLPEDELIDLEDDEPDVIEDEPPPLRPPRILRQAPNRPTTIRLSPDASRSWWVTADRIGFSHAAEIERSRMMRAKFGRAPRVRG